MTRPVQLPLMTVLCLVAAYFVMGFGFGELRAEQGQARVLAQEPTATITATMTVTPTATDAPTPTTGWQATARAAQTQAAMWQQYAYANQGLYVACVAGRATQAAFETERPCTRRGLPLRVRFPIVLQRRLR